MRKLKLQVQMTVDGYIGGPNGEMDWATLPWTDDINNYVGAILEPVDTFVLGRKLAEGFIPYWAGVAADPDNPEVESGNGPLTAKLLNWSSFCADTAAWSGTLCLARMIRP